MKRACILSLCLFSVLLGCGKSTEEANAAKPSTSNPPSTTPTSGLHWTDAQINQATQSCASRGDKTYSLSQWKTFCSCVYTKAAEKWGYDEFFNNFDTAYKQLTNENVVINCLVQAKILDE